MIVFIFLVYLLFQATAVIAWSFVSAEHMRIARRVWMDNWCFYLLYISHIVYQWTVLFKRTTVFMIWILFSAAMFISIPFVEESILHFTAMPQTMNQAREKKKLVLRSPHTKITPCKTSPPKCRLFFRLDESRYYGTEVSLREGAGGVMSERLHTHQ